MPSTSVASDHQSTAQPCSYCTAQGPHWFCGLKQVAALLFVQQAQEGCVRMSAQQQLLAAVPTMNATATQKAATAAAVALVTKQYTILVWPTNAVRFSRPSQALCACLGPCCQLRECHAILEALLKGLHHTCAPFNEQLSSAALCSASSIMRGAWHGGMLAWCIARLWTSATWALFSS